MGGPPITLCDAPGAVAGSWAQDDTIVFSAGGFGNLSLYRVSAAGGEPEILATPNPDQDVTGYWSPEGLPGQKAVLLTVSTADDFQIRVLSPESGEEKIVLEGGREARYVPSGHLVYEVARTGDLMAVPFDLASLEVTGNPVPVLEGVRQNDPGLVDYSVSQEGTLVYVLGGGRQEGNLVWVDREGTEQLVTQETRSYTVPRLSPDGKRVSLTISEEDGSRNVWIYDLEHDLVSRLTFEGAQNGPQIWTPDGKWITFASNRNGPRHLFRRLADGSTPAELLLSEETPNPNSWSPDGSVLTFHIGGDIAVLSIGDEGNFRPLIDSSDPECCAAFSPDGRWLAYVADEEGQPRLYVSPYPEPSVKFLVSAEEAGGEPVWSPDGRELFYRSGSKMMVVSVETEPTFRAGRQRVVCGIVCRQRNKCWISPVLRYLSRRPTLPDDQGSRSRANPYQHRPQLV